MLPLLCSSQSPMGVHKEGAKVGPMPLLPGPNTTPSRTGTLWLWDLVHPKCLAPFLWVWDQTQPPVAGSCWGDTQPSLPTGHHPVSLELYFFLSFH